MLAENLHKPHTFLAMKPSAALNAHREEIREIVLTHRASNARVFGSVVHGTDTDNSDLDILIDPSADPECDPAVAWKTIETDLPHLKIQVEQ